MKHKFTFKKIIFICFLSVALVFMPIQAHKAGALWGEFPAQILANVLTQIREMIMGIIMGMMKQMATQMLNREMGNMIGGSSSQNAKFITDWKDYMFTQPQQKANQFMNDYLSQVTRGRGSYSGYMSTSEGFGNGAFMQGMGGGNFIQSMVEGAKRQTTEQVEAAITYVGNPAQNLFAGGNFNNLNLYLSGINNPWAFNINAQQKYQEQLTKQQEIAKTMGMSYQGFIGTMSGNMITNPGSLIKENMANVQDLGNKVLANAKSIPEVITSIVQQIITKAIQNGIGNAQRNVQREIQNVQNQATQQINSQVQQYGPGALYGNAQNQMQGAH